MKKPTNGKAPAAKAKAKKPAAAKVKQTKKAAANGSHERVSLRDKKLFPVVEDNPFKRGWSKDSWDQIAKKPGKTFRQYLEEGGRLQSISHAIRVGWLRAED